MHLRAIVVIAIVIGRIKSEETTGASLFKNENVKGAKTESSDNFSPSERIPKNYSESHTETKNSVNYFGGHINSTERLRKPFLYGKKFEVPIEGQTKPGNGELYSPIITSAILTLPYHSADLGPGPQNELEVSKENQNEIFSSMRNSIKKTTEESFNKNYFAENVDETDNKKEEATVENTRREDFKEKNNLSSSLRQQGERALLVVLPFKADEENMEELFTKSPMVKVIENGELDASFKPEDIDSLRVTKEIIPTTYESVTRKRWRPMKRYQLLTEAYDLETSTENAEDITKTYMNYDNVELVTKKYQALTEESEKLTNHKYEDKFIPYPVYKEVKIKQDETTEVFQLVSHRPTETKPKRKDQRRKSTTEGPPKPEELSKVLDILPPDVKDLILHIGLNKENKGQQASEDKFRLERAPQPTIDPKSYSVFKPLPLVTKDENRNFVSDDMKDFLTSFGLLPMGRRVHKSLKGKTIEADKNMVMDLDFLPKDLKSLLEEMGLVKSGEKREPTRIHIFNPSNYSIARNEEDKEKLNAILNSIKTTVNESQFLTAEMQTEIISKIRDLNNLRYKAGNLTDINNEIQKIVVNKSNDKKPRTARRVKKLNEGPDPLVFHDDSLLRNDVKRQDSANSSSESSYALSSSYSESGSASSNASAPSSSGVAETVTEETPNIEALKESFGGGETAPDDADIESSLPPRRPNGLYLLLDWNSFLEVGTEDDKRRVNLRFQPKIGDSRNFLPVSVP